ncbi:unnamed protein product [Boreogadus saida]
MPDWMVKCYVNRSIPIGYSGEQFVPGRTVNNAFCPGWRSAGKQQMSARVTLRAAHLLGWVFKSLPKDVGPRVLKESWWEKVPGSDGWLGSRARTHAPLQGGPAALLVGTSITPGLPPPPPAKPQTPTTTTLDLP